MRFTIMILIFNIISQVELAKALSFFSQMPDAYPLTKQKEFMTLHHLVSSQPFWEAELKATPLALRGISPYLVWNV
jgi:hypothetical protein